MKLRVFQSDKGDCMLLSSSDNANMLIDGGMATSFNEHTARYLNRYVDTLDRICVTHIDQDHIHGILELCEHLLDWRVYHYQHSVDNTGYRKPRAPEPPPVTSFWHNSFNAQFGTHTDELAGAARSLSSIFSVGRGKNNQHIAEILSGIATSQRQGYLLARKIGRDLLNIPVNPERNGDLLVVEQGANTFSLGSTRIRLIAPFQEDIDKLSEEWQQWLGSASGSAAVERIHKAIGDDSDRLGPSNAAAINRSLRVALREVRINLEQLGIRNNVTTPNLASIMFIAEEGAEKILFTGDGHWSDIDKGIMRDGSFDPQQGIHFDIIKVPHHGSEHNSNLSFWRRMTADHYVFCSDGSHHNPDTEIIEKIIQSREEDRDKNLAHSRKKYKFWFNSSVDVTRPGNRDYMKQLRTLVRRKARQSDGRLRYTFLSGHSFVVN